MTLVRFSGDSFFSYRFPAEGKTTFSNRSLKWPQKREGEREREREALSSATHEMCPARLPTQSRI